MRCGETPWTSATISSGLYLIIIDTACVVCFNFSDCCCFFDCFRRLSIFIQISRIFAISIFRKCYILKNKNLDKLQEFVFEINMTFFTIFSKIWYNHRTILNIFRPLLFWECCHQKERQKSGKRSYWMSQNSMTRPRTSPWNPPKSEKSEKS